MKKLMLVFGILAGIVIFGTGCTLTDSNKNDKNTSSGYDFKTTVDAVTDATHNNPKVSESLLDSSENAGDIGLEEAKKIAISQVSGSSAANIIKAKKDYEDDYMIFVYEIEMLYGDKEYDFEISSVDGSILSMDTESVYD